MKIHFTKPDFFIFLFAILPLSFISAQRGDIVEENRYIEFFDAISVSGGIDLYLTQGNEHKIKIVANDDMMKDIETELDGSKLIIGMKRNKSWWGNNKKDPIKVYVTFEDLKHINASGGSDVFGETKIESDELSIKGSGGCDIKLEIMAQSLVCSTSGGSDLYLEGKVENLEATSSGGSDLNARDLEVQDCYLQSSGGSDAEVTVYGDLEVSASGASDAYIYGSPNIISKKSSGASDIHIRS